jgi:hypothetical protein
VLWFSGVSRFALGIGCDLGSHIWGGGGGFGWPRGWPGVASGVAVGLGKLQVTLRDHKWPLTRVA